MDTNEKIRLNELILASIDNCITPEEFEELESRLSDNPDAQRHYSKMIKIWKMILRSLV